eukprot:scaffold9037_cov150-Skeletonema_menzelii.AAC.5
MVLGCVFLPSGCCGGGRVASFLAAAGLALTRGVFSCCGGGCVLLGQLLLTYLLSLGGVDAWHY